MDAADFQTQFENRLLAIAEDYIGADIALVPSNRTAEFEDGSTLTVGVEMGDEDPPGSGWYNCEISAIYNFRDTDPPENVSQNWGKIEEAFGSGYENNYPLRNRLAEGRLSVAGGDESIVYDGQETEPNQKTLTFSAILGISTLN